MKIKTIKIKDFKRYTDLFVKDIPEQTKMVVLVGPNGSGKTSLFEAFNYWGNAFRGVNFSKDYHVKSGTTVNHNWDTLHRNIQIEFYGEAPNPHMAEEKSKKAFYFRSAFRLEPDFATSGIKKVGEPLEDQKRPPLLISTDTRVADNYHRIIANTVAEIYSDSDESITKGVIKNRIIGKVRNSMQSVFGDLLFSGPGDPMLEGTFYFEKGESKNWKYKNLSGGEKAAFDLLLDFILKIQYFNNTIFCIDEPELHMHTRLQAKLLEEMFINLPENCQLWIATHSIGMMRKAMELHKKDPTTITFLDFENYDFDKSTEMTPVKVDRNLWKRIFSVALDDIAELIAPSQIVFCEGKPISDGKTRNTEFDAKIYRKIFSSKYPEVEFISLGGTNDLEKDSVKIASAIGQLFTSIKMVRLFDRDDRSVEEIVDLKKDNSKVLSLRDLENYLWDDDVLRKLCKKYNAEDKINEILVTKTSLLEKAKTNDKPEDDIKYISGELYVTVKNKLKLTQCGNDKENFCISTLAPLITEESDIYKMLERDIFNG